MKILSLFWHGVESDSIDSESLVFSNPTVSMFRDQIKFIVNKYTPISIFDFMKITRNKRLIRSYTKPPVLLGFDDGFKNVIDRALAILKEFEVPALFFVIGETLKDPNFVPWFVEAKQIIRRTKQKTIVYDNVKIDLDLKQGRKLIMRRFQTYYKACRLEEGRQRLLTDLANQLSVRRPMASELDEDIRLASKADLSKIGSTSLLTVASHTMSHRFLDSLSFDDQVNELEQSDYILKEHCPSYYPVVSYPLGFFNNDSVKIARRIYKSAFATLPGSSYHNIYRYPRTCIGHCNAQELNYVLSTIRLNFLRPLKRILHDTGIRKI